MKTSKIILIHVCFWLINTIFNAVFWGVNEDISFFYMIIPFYINYFFFVPKLLTKNKPAYFVIWFVLVWGIMIGTFVGYYVFLDAFIMQFKHFDLKRTFAISGYISFYYISISTGGRLFLYWLDNLKKNNDLLRLKTIKQVQLMKSNINIPFVVNSLTYSQNIAKKTPSNAEESIILLSNVLRYGLYETQSDFNPLNRELEVLSDYITLQNNIDSRFHIVLNTDLKVENNHIVPNILVRFVGFWKEHLQKQLIGKQEIILSSLNKTVELNLPLPSKTDKFKSSLEKTFPTYEDQNFSVSYKISDDNIILKITTLSI